MSAVVVTKATTAVGSLPATQLRADFFDRRPEEHTSIFAIKNNKKILEN